MRWICLSIGALLALASLSWAFDEPKKKPPAKEPAAKEANEKTIAEQMEAVQTELATTQQELIKEFQATDDDAEKAKIIERFKNLQSDTAAKYLAIVKDHPDDDGIIPTLQTLVAIGEQFPLTVPEAEKPLLAVTEKAKSNDAKGLAFLALGQLFMARSGEDGVEEEDRDKLREKAIEALETVVNEYTDVRTPRGTAGDTANRVLFEVKYLAIGREVPDLEGKDLDDKEFKLSDYRGKVVFLDFWAHW
jgi:hypothetical protein